jgi:hypothetical protein
MNILHSLFLSERGEVGDDQTTDAPEQDQGTGEVAENTGLITADSTEQPITDETQGQQEETFVTGDENLDPRKLDPALQPIFKRLQASYTKKMQAASQIQEKASIVDRFYNDPTFAHQTLAQWAATNGFQLTRGGQAEQGQQQANGNVPAYLVEAFKKNLDPALHWMAEPQANAMWSAMQGMLNPVFQQQQQQTQRQKEQEWQKSADELGQLAPGWEEHEDVMGDLFDFLRSPELHHPKYGSKLQMLYDLATAKAASLKQAQGRVAQAGKNRVSSSRSNGARPNIETEMTKASPQDAWKLAVKHALAQHQKSSS